MTWPQIQALLNHPMSEHGGLKPILEGDDAPSPEEHFREQWRRRGLRDDETRWKWDEFLEVEWHKGQMEAEGKPPEEIAKRCREIEREQAKARPWRVR